MNIPDAAARVAELEARLATKEQELREAKNRYDELRHRITNDLQALTCLLSVQARAINQPDYCGRCISRLSSTVALHKTLDHDGSDVISMAGYLTALSGTLKNSFGDRIFIKTTVEPGMDLDHRRAQCVGLIYAEAAMNALKHAFPSDAVGKMEVQFRRLDNSFEMMVTDDGVGFDLASAQMGCGIQLMKQFAQQLKGTLQLERLPIGMMIHLTFPASI